MTSHEMTLSLEQFALTAARSADPTAFRIVMRSGELLRVPKARRSIRVVAGAAWVSNDRGDAELRAGDVLPLLRSRQDTLVSAEGNTLLLEIA